MKPALPAAVFFDLDGTLVDSAPDLGAAADFLRAERGLPPLGFAAYRPAASTGAAGLLRVAFGIGPEDAEFEPLRQGFLRYYEAHIADHSQAFAGIAELLAALQTRGIAWGIITNKAEHLARCLVAQMPLLQSAAAIVGGDSAAQPKPSAAPMQLAAQLAGVDLQNSWYVGDDIRDMQAAHAAAMPCAIAAAWGYAPAADIAQWPAHAICQQPQDILTLLPAQL